MGHTTRYGNYYTEQEWKEVQAQHAQMGEDAAAEIQKLEDLIEEAAGHLAREFSDTPKNSWQAGLNASFDIMDNREIRFTSDKKQERFEAAVAWIEKQIQ